MSEEEKYIWRANQGWEILDEASGYCGRHTLKRRRVEGGWLYFHREIDSSTGNGGYTFSGLTFVPDPVSKV